MTLHPDPNVGRLEGEQPLHGADGSAGADPAQRLRLRVTGITWENETTRSFELRALDGSPLPFFTAGAHIDLHLPIGLVRSYSLLNSQREQQRYVIGVSRDKHSRGGSRWLHDKLAVGDILFVDAPRNHFALAEEAEFTFLLAGGIGITPLLCMADRLRSLGRRWKLLYCARSVEVMAFRDQLAELAPDVQLHLDDVAGGPVALSEVFAPLPAGAHVYCCGPAPMIEAAAAAAADRGLVFHAEYFAPAMESATEGGYSVELAKTGLVLSVPPGRSILEVVEEAGVTVAQSCLQGVCGRCETAVLSGEPDHRDSILSPAEKKANNTMMICCSGSKTARLILDL